MGHTENIHCNNIKSRRLVTAPDKKILKMTKQPSPKFQRVSHPLFFDFYLVFMEWFFNTTNMASLGVKPLNGPQLLSPTSYVYSRFRKVFGHLGAKTHTRVSEYFRIGEYINKDKNLLPYSLSVIFRNN